MKDLFTALGILFLAAEYAFMAANVPSVALFAGLLALTALYAVRIDQRREEASNEVRRSNGSRPFRMPDMTFVPARAAKPAIRHRAVKAA